jgi:hypothetical protein
MSDNTTATSRSTLRVSTCWSRCSGSAAQGWCRCGEGVLNGPCQHQRYVQPFIARSHLLATSLTDIEVRCVVTAALQRAIQAADHSAYPRADGRPSGNQERDDHCHDGKRQGDPEHPPNNAGRATLSSLGRSLDHGRRPFRHCRYSVATISASPLSGSFRLCRCRGDSVSTTSRVGRTCASRRCPPIAMPSARLTTT